MTAKSTADVLFNEFFVHYGFPKIIHSDQGANFESRLIKELCSLAHINKSHTTPYHAQGNGMCERYDRTLLNMLGTLKPQQKSDWKSHVAPLVHAYICTRHDSTVFAPLFLMFGRNPRLSIDIMFGIEENESYQSYTDYINSLKDRLQSAYDLATKEANKHRAKQKFHFDLKARATVIHPGDRVLVRINAYEGKHKIADRWEDDVYVVTKQPNTYVPVFIVKRENDSDRNSRTLHRNLLLSIGSLLLATSSLLTSHQVVVHCYIVLHFYGGNILWWLLLQISSFMYL